jgi:5-methylcytosine-specific restriction endonuclease McrA
VSKVSSETIKKRRFLKGLSDEQLKCYYCGKQLNRGKCTVGHVVPKSKGGKNSFDNFVVSCYECNNKKGNLNYLAFVIKNKIVDEEKILREQEEAMNIAKKD